jgi:hypothetical protein
MHNILRMVRFISLGDEAGSPVQLFRDLIRQIGKRADGKATNAVLG